MKIIGITGSVAMGKSSTVKMLRYLGYPVFDADAEVAKLYAQDTDFIEEVMIYFPEAVDLAGRLDKVLLAQRVFSDNSARKTLEGLIHPRVWHASEQFTRKHQRLRTRFVFWDVPLLFQSRMQHSCDEIWVVSASEFLQRRRALRRKGWDEQRFEAIRAIQLPPFVQERMADRLIATGLGKAHTLRCLKQYISGCFT